MNQIQVSKEKIVRIIAVKGLTQKKLCEDLDITPIHFSRCLSNGFLSEKVAAHLCQVLDVPIEILQEKEQQNPLNRNFPSFEEIEIFSNLLDAWDALTKEDHKYAYSSDVRDAIIDDIFCVFLWHIEKATDIAAVKRGALSDAEGGQLREDMAKQIAHRLFESVPELKEIFEKYKALRMNNMYTWEDEDDNEYIIDPAKY